MERVGVKGRLATGADEPPGRGFEEYEIEVTGRLNRVDRTGSNRPSTAVQVIRRNDGKEVHLL